MYVHKYDELCALPSLAVSSSIPVRQAYYGSLPSHPIFLDDLVCRGDENSLLDCPRQPAAGIGLTDCSHSEDAGVRCEGMYTTVHSIVVYLHICT